MRISDAVLVEGARQGERLPHRRVGRRDRVVIRGPAQPVAAAVPFVNAKAKLVDGGHVAGDDLRPERQMPDIPARRGVRRQRMKM